jgi:Rieske [2Fe-2S] domain
MGTTQSTPAGPELAQGIPESDLPEGRMLAGHVGEEAVLLARSGAEIFAIGATCTHYGGPLADGLMATWREHSPRPRPSSNPAVSASASRCCLLT